MSANRIFVVCSHHPTIDEALCLAERLEWGLPYEPGNYEHAKEWFQRHQKCGRGNTADHFKLALHRPQDHDRPLMTVDKGVRLSLVTSAINQELDEARRSQREQPDG